MTLVALRKKGVWKVDHAVLCEVASGMRALDGAYVGVVPVIPRGAGKGAL